MALEPRILYDGAAGAVLADALIPSADAFHPTETIHDAGELQPTETIHDASSGVETGLSDQTPFLPFAPETAAESTSHEIIFIDPTVKNAEQLAASLRLTNPNSEIIFLDASGDCIDQMADVLSTRSGITAVHLISHGETGSVHLGNANLSTASLSEYASDLARIGSGLTADGDILIYGCDVAKGETGSAFISALAGATGADIAASDNATGAAILGGDWILEKNTGNIEAQALTPLQYDGLSGASDHYEHCTPDTDLRHNQCRCSYLSGSPLAKRSRMWTAQISRSLRVA